MWCLLIWYLLTIASEEPASTFQDSCFPPKDGGNRFLRNIDKQLSSYAPDLFKAPNSAFYYLIISFETYVARCTYHAWEYSSELIFEIMNLFSLK